MRVEYKHWKKKLMSEVEEVEQIFALHSTNYHLILGTPV